MVRSAAIEVIARHLGLNSGRLSALAQRLAEAGELPKGCGRSVPALSPSSLAKILLCAIADRGLGNAAASVREFAALRSDNGATLLDLLEGWISGALAVSEAHSVIAQLSPGAVTIVTPAGRLHYGPPREHGVAVHLIVVSGAQLRSIISELRGVKPCDATAATAV